MKILIAGAWPYANGPLHIGHIASLLPGDVLARYHRAAGDEVYYVSGSDCHGTPVAIRAQQQDTAPAQIAQRHHLDFCACFARLGFSYDRYGSTMSPEHVDFVQTFHRALYEGGYVYRAEALQAFCPGCQRALADRFVVGICPECEGEARGDQCDRCGALLDAESLLRPACSLCASAPQFRPATHLFLALSRLADRLDAYATAHPEWRKNAAAFTRRYLDEGLRDRAITRDIDWGIDVPAAGFDGKKIYIWAENVLGYLSMSRSVCAQRGADFRALWGQGDVRHYYVHGKDNIPFHTVILPGLLLAHGGGWRLPDRILSSEYLTLQGEKISTSRNWAVWADELAQRFDPDSIRYHLLASGPERRDADFSYLAFVQGHNADLAGILGNFIHRTLAFLFRYGDRSVPDGSLAPEAAAQIERAYTAVGALIEGGRFRDALRALIGLARFGNRHFDAEAPWSTRREDPAACANTLFTCVQIAANLAVLLSPFLPFSMGKLRAALGVASDWKPQFVPAGAPIPEPEIYFPRLDIEVAIQAEKQLRDRARG